LALDQAPKFAKIGLYILRIAYCEKPARVIMRMVTLCLPIRNAPGIEVLLGWKKRGFGQGKYSGFGGKVAPDETTVAAAIRELSEEAGLLAHQHDLVAVGVLDFCFPGAPAWDQRVSIYLVPKWTGRPCESDEMAPVWFPIAQLPYDPMWQDARYWMPQVLNGDRLNAKITFAADNETVARVEPRYPIRPTDHSFLTCGASLHD
jgi:8-oxo-dGTP diphosphatase